MVNSHNEPHDLIIVVTENEKAKFARSVHIHAAVDGEYAIDSKNKVWTNPVGQGRYVISVKVDDQPPRSRRYKPYQDSSCLRAILNINRDGQFSFTKVHCE
ncbi:hypothetical protein ZOD2009_05287 [Haladaptatus paucihalophilus DX253]|uniref:Uncharacterized protein n=1 Tax=Haladaptatus paucihalophilus DX253 TaxID=797209 RepID=E7QQI7_HALPU|nr:hypothetical protein ZOD2009_05287 [Haladaptatus paucihalophilus DX253]